MSHHDHEYIKAARRTIEMEVQAVQALSSRIDDAFIKACDLMLNCKGRVVVTGMGKSGHIGNKIAATLASTGTPSFFLHPGEASHGDLGMVTPNDVVLAISNSGNTAEIVTILPLLKRMGVPLVSMTGKPDSTLSQIAEANIDASVATEACPLGLAPTSSTTVCLVLGDALAIALLEARGFTAEDFAFSHPGGALGRRLLLKISDIMHSGDAVPVVRSGASLSESLLQMSQKGLGMTCIVDEDDKLLGVFTDGDLRRTLDKNIDIRSCAIDVVMTTHCKSVTKDMLAAEALGLMQEKKINALPVVDADKKVIGAFNTQDMLRAGVI
ncbi:predicted sugar phosphate isomerase involved in capsule formation [Hahella chejuensis KCTC 2396]|uniref:Arabinose 5-phosphate isomerase n=1 Tax=Hahella chejuensis (strain KCTC 2396) TaxID=349521 RepID=Q2SBI6_HAHCH|nr:KpsF/GutQ family sugar-phosphate isomerase [Hahella chejuensis]ABC31988.1 predicted sugar phosphate isomerase involved in capsule formation [Hahella chejuensis KCTC 2396]